MPYASDEELFPVWREPRSIWERSGLTATQQRVLDFALVALLTLFSAGWIYTAVTAIQRGDAPRVAREVGSGGSPFSGRARPEATFAMNALIESMIDWEEIRGQSGELQIAFQEEGSDLALPDSAAGDVEVSYVPVEAGVGDSLTTAPQSASPSPPTGGIWNVLLQLGGAVRSVPRLSVATLIPSTRIDEGYIDGYRIGEWPDEEGVYAPPRGLVRVTPENMETPVSTHFKLSDFLTKGQDDVWPKYVVLSPRLLDKLELTLKQLEADGHPVEDVFVISGFRTPWYNRAGGNTQGRGSLSRHMYGDAADIAIDNNGDACMDDLTGDGRATIADARVIVEAAEQVERDYPNLVGGIGIYAPVPGSHCGMVHIDTRGHRARW